MLPDDVFKGRATCVFEDEGVEVEGADFEELLAQHINDFVVEAHPFHALFL